MSDLRVLIDGADLPPDEARALWRRFSAWMNERAGDLAGFAHAEGLASIRPELHDGDPVLVGSRTAPQTPYGPAAKKRAPSGAGTPRAPKAPRSRAPARNERPRKPPKGRG